VGSTFLLLEIFTFSMDSDSPARFVLITVIFALLMIIWEIYIYRKYKVKSGE